MFFFVGIPIPLHIPLFGSFRLEAWAREGSVSRQTQKFY